MHYEYSNCCIGKVFHLYVAVIVDNISVNIDALWKSDKIRILLHLA